jgi:hypothetical protein
LSVNAESGAFGSTTGEFGSNLPPNSSAPFGLKADSVCQTRAGLGDAEALPELLTNCQGGDAGLKEDARDK